MPISQIRAKQNRLPYQHALNDREKKVESIMLTHCVNLSCQFGENRISTFRDNNWSPKQPLISKEEDEDDESE